MSCALFRDGRQGARWAEADSASGSLALICRVTRPSDVRLQGRPGAPAKPKQSPINSLTKQPSRLLLSVQSNFALLASLRLRVSVVRQPSDNVGLSPLITSYISIS